MQSPKEKLQKQREEKLKQLNDLEEFRRGTVSLIERKCGKKSCWCAASGSKGHTQYIWNATIKSKSVAKNLRMGSEIKKYLEETERYKEFKRLCEELITINESLCEVGPVAQLSEEREMALKKKLQKQLQKKRKKR